MVSGGGRTGVTYQTEVLAAEKVNPWEREGSRGGLYVRQVVYCELSLSIMCLV